MLIVEHWTDGPLLKETLERVPEMSVRPEEQHDDGEVGHYILWAEGGDFEAFEANLDADPSVTDPRTLTKLETRRLYRVSSTEGIYETATHPRWSDLGLVFLEAEATHEGWTFRMQVPDREALAEYRDLYRERDRPFQLRTIYRESDARGGPEPELTDPQREALVAAYESGYFDVPQEVSQADVAARLDISPQALSERLQRGTRTLVGATLVFGST